MIVEKKLTFFSPGQVKGLNRTRAAVFNGHAKVYEDSDSKSQKAYVRQACIREMKETGIHGIPHYTDRGISVSIDACFIPPESMSKKKRLAIATGCIRPCKKPDVDNIAKLVLDALNGVIYKDDKDVSSLTVFKRYCADTQGLVVSLTWSEEVEEETREK